MLGLQFTLGQPSPFLGGETEAQSLAYIRVGQACVLALHPRHFVSLPRSRWWKE